MNPRGAAVGAVCLWLLAAGALSVSGTPAAQGAGAPQGPQTDVTTVLLPRLAPTEGLDANAVEAWTARWFARRLADPENGAPGAVVSIVQNGRVVLAAGYGLADIARRSPARADTVFRVGSVSKPVTATAVMQLVESGAVDPTHPVSEYVHDLALAAWPGRPVTVIDLVTHTGGHDTRLAGTAAPSDRDVLPLRVYLRAGMPPLVRRPGSVLSYSNHGYALLGHLVEAVSGLPFERYVDERIFRPLGMDRSGFRLTPRLEALAATGYEPSSSGFRRAAVVHPHIYPAAGLNTTAEDMARFLVAQLHAGEDGSGILSRASLSAMHRQQFTMSPAAPGVAFGFFENLDLGEPALVHAGGIRGFMSGVAIWPGRHMGVFVSNNGYSADLVREFVVAFARRFVAPSSPRPDGTARRTTLEPITGSYRAASQPIGSIERAGELRSADLELGISYLRRLTIDRYPFVEVAPGVFAGEYTRERVVVVRAPGGGPARLVTSDPFNGNVTWEKVPWYRSARCHRELLLAFVLALGSALLPLGRLRRLVGAPGGAGSAAPPVAARVLVRMVAAIDLAFLAVLVVSLRLARETGLLFGIPPLARFALWLPAVAAAGAAVLPWFAWRGWRRGDGSAPWRAHCAACAAAAIGFAAWCWYWNLLGA